MDDKKENNNTTNEANETPFDALTKKAQDQVAEFGSAGHDDINKNVGSFGETKQPAEVQQNQPDLKLDVDAKVVEKASQEKINFERFSKTKRSEKAAKTKFGEKVSIMLRTKKGLVTTWVIEMVVMIAVIVCSALFIGFLTKYKGVKGDEGDGGVVPLPEVQKPLNVGLVFAWISLFPCLIPIVYLITTWFIGINEVAKSRLFHFMFWICALISLICFLVALGCLIYPIQKIAQYPPF